MNRKSAWSSHACVFLFFVVLTAALHLPVVLHPFTNVLAGQQVGGYFCWLFWWWSHALRAGLPLFHTDLLMFPEGVPLFLHAPVSELPALLLEPLLRPYATLNFLLLMTYPLTGLASYVLFERLTKNVWASLCGAFAHTFGTYMITQHLLGQVIETNIFFNPLFALALLDYEEEPTAPRALWVGAAFLGVLLSGPYVGFSFGFIFLAAAVMYDLSRKKRRLLVWETGHLLFEALAGAVLIAALAYSPLLRYAGRWMGGTYTDSPSLLSFLAPPQWHRLAFIQRLYTFAPLRPVRYLEASITYIGVGTGAVILAGLAKGSSRRAPFRFWGWVFLFSSLMSLGPWLKFTPGSTTWFPLPYYLISKLPLLSIFRSPGRIAMTASLASSALAAVAMDHLTAGQPVKTKAWLAVLFMGFVFCEFDLPSLGRHFVSAAPSPIYQKIKDDPGRFAVLELPSGYDQKGDLDVRGQYYMLFQPFHQKPMVLGFPSRYLASDLAFTENTPVVYELTHPWVLKLLHRRRLKARGWWIVLNGAKTLRGAGIKYVLYHAEVPFYQDVAVDHDIKPWLDRMLGPPLEQDGPLYLYRTGR